MAVDILVLNRREEGGLATEQQIGVESLHQQTQWVSLRHAYINAVNLS